MVLTAELLRRLDPIESVPELDGAERLIHNALGEDSLRVDEILDNTELPLPEVNALLLKLEIQGLVCQLPGGRFARK